MFTLQVHIRVPRTGGKNMVYHATSPQVRRLDIGDGIVAPVDQIRGQDIRTGQDIMERTRLGCRVQSEYNVFDQNY